MNRRQKLGVRCRIYSLGAEDNLESDNALVGPT